MAHIVNGWPWTNLNSSVHNINRRHISYVGENKLELCYLDEQQLFDHKNACNFIKATATCNAVKYWLNYLDILVCGVGISASTLGLIELFLIFLSVIVFLVAFMFLLTKYFILPNVLHVAEYMRMPLYEFGVAVIAVLISGPEIMWIIKECNDISGSGTLMIANMMGKILATFTLGVSVVCFGQHTKLPGKEVIKHILLSIAILVLSYVMINQRLSDDLRPEEDEEDELDLTPAALFLTVIYVFFLIYTIAMKRHRNKRSSVHSRFHHHLPIVETFNGWEQLWQALNPFGHMNAPRCFIAILAPIWVMAALQVPVIDEERQMFGWCKYLTCVNICFLPLLMYLHHEMSILFYTLLFCCFILLIITIVCTKTNEPPKYQGFYAVLGIILGIYSYRIVQGELETILWQSCSFIFNMKRDVIMLTGYVFHFILNLVIFCVQLVVDGYGNLACGVVIGIVLNEVFLVLPTLTFHTCNEFDNIGAISANTTTCFVFVILSFILAIFCVSLTDFKLRISQGVFLVSIYVIFLIYVLLSGLSVMHPYGGSHALRAGTQKESAHWA